MSKFFPGVQVTEHIQYESNEREWFDIFQVKVIFVGSESKSENIVCGSENLLDPHSVGTANYMNTVSLTARHNMTTPA
jgi:hypothetical protein